MHDGGIVVENGQYTNSESIREEQNDISIHEDSKPIKIPSSSWISHTIDRMVDNTMPVMFKTQLDLANKNMKKIVDYIMRHL